MKIFIFCAVPALLAPLPLMPFTTETVTGCTNEASNGANKDKKKMPSCLFILCFTVSVFLSIDASESSNNFMILIISFLSSFKINKVNLFPALTAPFPVIFLWNLFIPFEVKLLTNPDKLSLAKGVATFVSAFFLN